MTEKKAAEKTKVRDAASRETIAKAGRDGVTLTFDRLDQQGKGCGFGLQGLCCRLCHMGPCRISAKAPKGVCGADADTIAARNFLREAAGGAAAHSDHARHLVLLLKKIARGKGGDYGIRDSAALRRTALKYGIAAADRDDNSIALELADAFLADFVSQEEPLKTLSLAPLKRRGLWDRAGVSPRGIDRMVVEAMHRTHMGVDHDYKNLLMHAFRTSLADGWGGSSIATAVSDILFGSPSPVRSGVNLGVLKEETVNVVVHGHEPALSEMLAAAATDPEVLARAKERGAKGVTLAGICCTANEILMRHGIPVAGNFLQQELAVVTGAVEMMIVDVQCCMPSLPEVASSYHTIVASTSDIAMTPGARHEGFTAKDSYAHAKGLLMQAIDNFPKRDPEKLYIPKESKQLIAGFGVEAIRYMLGGSFRASFRPLNDAIIQGRIRGVAGIVGCSNPKQAVDEFTVTLTKELLRRNVLVLETGCAAIASAKEGMLTPETALESAGSGLREVCEAVGMPPVLHMGSCVDNSRILEAATEVVMEGGLGDDLSDIPAVGIAPEWMSEKAVAIGCYFVASGIDVVLGHPFYLGGSDNATDFMNGGVREVFGASFHLRGDPLEAADLVMELIEARRDRLGINRAVERKLMDMKDRRALDV